MLDHVAAFDPEPEALDTTLADFIEGLGPPSGPARALAVEFREEWQAACVAPEWTAHLLHEAICCPSPNAPSPNARTGRVSDQSSRYLGARAIGAAKTSSEAALRSASAAQSWRSLAGGLYGCSGGRAADIGAEKAQAKLGGASLLRGESLAIDEKALGRRWTAICTALHQSRPMRSPLPSGRESFVHACFWTASWQKALHPWRRRRKLLLWMLPWPRPSCGWRRCRRRRSPHGPLPARSKARPGKPAIARAAAVGRSWAKRAGWSRTAICAAAYVPLPVPCGRLYCPFCGNRDYQTLGYLHVEGEEDRYRAGACDACQGYVKWVSTIFALTEPQLLVADLATMHLDLAAAERGFYIP